jgi:hypothetical protein
VRQGSHFVSFAIPTTHFPTSHSSSQLSGNAFEGHLAHLHKEGNYGEDKFFDIPSNVFDASKANMQEKMVEHHVVSQAGMDVLPSPVVEPDDPVTGSLLSTIP